VTRKLWDTYQAHVRDEAGDNHGWLTPVFGVKAASTV
jgi:hypothetical protein